MSLILKLPGRRALSEFRLHKLLQQAKDPLPSLTGIATQYWHFIKLRRLCRKLETAALRALLVYGREDLRSVADKKPLTADILLVVPGWHDFPLGLQGHGHRPSVWAGRCGAHRARYRVSPAGRERIDSDAAAAARAVALIHDRMIETVLDSLNAADALFHEARPAPLTTISILAGGRFQLKAADRRLGLALSDDEVDYLARLLRQHRRADRRRADGCLRGPTPSTAGTKSSTRAGSSMANLDGVAVRHDQEHARDAPAGTLVAYADNAAVMEGARVDVYPADDRYRFSAEPTDILMKVETHNHPTAISPFAGTATGSGREIRDEGATGRGAKPKAGLTGFTTFAPAHPRIRAGVGGTTTVSRHESRRRCRS
jgi:phosphoribosylformylglycinamidine synthase